MRKIPLILLTGFLGSGKTTLLNALLQTPQLADSAVLINEFGEIALDHHLIAAVPQSTVVLGNGCICCTVRGELSGVLRTLFWRRQNKEVPDFRRVILETTGLADPAPILQELLRHPTLLQHYAVAGVVTCVDALFGAEQLRRQPESLKQALVADRLLITKTDLASEAQIVALSAHLRRLNPAATIHRLANGNIDPRILPEMAGDDQQGKSGAVQRWLRAGAYRQVRVEPDYYMRRQPGAAGSRHDRTDSSSLAFEQPLPRQRLLAALRMVAGIHGDHLLRIKGIVQFEHDDKPYVIHGIQQMIFPLEKLECWPEGMSGSQFVFIVRGLKAGLVADMLKQCIESTNSMAATD